MAVLTVILVLAFVTTLDAQLFGGGTSGCGTHCSGCTGGSCYQCDGGYFLTPSLFGGNTCEPCGPYCLHCSSADVCQVCENGYVQESTTGYCMWDPSHPCQANCLSCSSVETCSQCKTGFAYHAALGACVKDLHLCSSSSVHCAHCGEDPNCNSCIPGYALTHFAMGYCTACFQSECLVCQTPGACLHCKAGYSLLQPIGQCIPDCIDDCAICDEPNTCQLCNDGYEYISDDNECIEVVCMEHCASCVSSATCDECDDQYTYTDGQCQPDCIDNCALCDEPNTCQQCSTGYEYISEDNECIVLVCMDNCAHCVSSATCEQCADGYSYTGAQCEPVCIDNCASCDMPNTCQQCMTDYEYISGDNECIEIVCMAHCLACVSSFTCDQCEDQYTYTGGQCMPNCLANCAFCNVPNTCRQCADGYEYDFAAGQCVEIPVVVYRLRWGDLTDTDVGLVEILLDDVWHPVCAQEWDQADGNVLCGSLGYSNTGTEIYRVLVTDEVLEPYYSSFLCEGDEAELLECSHTAGAGIDSKKCNSNARFAAARCFHS